MQGERFDDFGVAVFSLENNIFNLSKGSTVTITVERAGIERQITLTIESTTKVS